MVSSGKTIKRQKNTREQRKKKRENEDRYYNN